MATINDGGPAFPVPSPDCQTFLPKKVEDLRRLMSGMSLRDYFAAKAMQGELASMQDPEGEACGISLDASDETLSRLARHYYRIADAMLKARDAQP